ncbi:type II toxin-antitoxin system HicB family antitoxin [Candidatus Peregrinibacteria bacterium]|nr:type II toxin-antitoxin system HicB family antitoxin [Candidatus Peregrinibacteria bacterium]
MARTVHRIPRRFTVVLEPAEEGGYVVHVPTLPGCHTQGETIEEAEANAKEAIECYLLSLHDRGEELPKELTGTRIITVSMNIDLQ